MMNTGTRTTASTLAMLLLALAAAPSFGAVIQVDRDVEELAPTVSQLRIQDGKIYLSIQEAIEIALERMGRFVQRHNLVATTA